MTIESSLGAIAFKEELERAVMSPLSRQKTLELICFVQGRLEIDWLSKAEALLMLRGSYTAFDPLILETHCNYFDLCNNLAMAISPPPINILRKAVEPYGVLHLSNDEKVELVAALRSIQRKQLGIRMI